MAGVDPARFPYQKIREQQSPGIVNPKKIVLVFKTGHGYGGWGFFDAVIMNSNKCSKLLKI